MLFVVTRRLEVGGEGLVELETDVREFENVQSEGYGAVGEDGDAYADERGAVLHRLRDVEVRWRTQTRVKYKQISISRLGFFHVASPSRQHQQSRTSELGGTPTMAEANYRSSLSACSSLAFPSRPPH